MGKGAAPPPRPGAVTLNEQLHRRAVELLEHKDWLDVEPVLRELMKLVPPGLAMRRAEKGRLNSVLNSRKEAGTFNEDAPPPARVKYTSSQEQVRFGARDIARELLGGPAYETKWISDRVQQIRLVHLPRAVKGDRLRGEVILPVLDPLVRVFLDEGKNDAALQVQLAAHEQGIHLAACRVGCTLGTTEFNLTTGGHPPAT